MQKYQLLYIVDSSLNEEAREELISRVESIITKNGGVIEGTEKSGVKKFAYPINYKTEGFYVLVSFSAEGNAPKTVGKQLNITEGVVRHMTVAK